MRQRERPCVLAAGRVTDESRDVSVPLTNRNEPGIGSGKSSGRWPGVIWSISASTSGFADALCPARVRDGPTRGLERAWPGPPAALPASVRRFFVGKLAPPATVP